MFVDSHVPFAMFVSASTFDPLSPLRTTRQFHSSPQLLKTMCTLGPLHPTQVPLLFAAIFRPHSTGGDVATCVYVAVFWVLSGYLNTCAYLVGWWGTGGSRECAWKGAILPVGLCQFW